MTARYCTAADLYLYGVPRGGLPNPGRSIASVSTSANTLALDVHGFADDDAVTFRAESGGSLPAPLVEGTTYYAILVNDNAFSVAPAAGENAVDLTSSGSRFIVIAAVPVTAAIEWASVLLEDMLPAHVVPLTEPYPPIVVATVAELAAGKLLALRGATTKSLSTTLDEAQKRLARWAKGIPLRGENVPAAAGVALSASAPRVDRRGWSRFGGIS